MRWTVRAAELAKVIPRRPRVAWWLGIALAAGFALLADAGRHGGSLARRTRRRHRARQASRVGHGARAAVRGLRRQATTSGGGVLDRARRGSRSRYGRSRRRACIATHAAWRGAVFSRTSLVLGVLAGDVHASHAALDARPPGPRAARQPRSRSPSLALAVKVVMLMTALSVLVVPVALFAMVPTLVLDRIVGLATGMLAALVVALLVPFDVGVAILLLVQAAAAGLVIAERPKQRLRAALIAGGGRDAVHRRDVPAAAST